MKSAIALSLCLCLVLSMGIGHLYAQAGLGNGVNNEMQTIDYEALTLRLFYEQKWDSLLVSGNEAIKEGYDYFYIQVRTGTAAFYLGKYSLAGKYLEEAARLNSTDEFTNELLFLTYIYTGRQNQAALFLTKISPDRHKVLSDDFINPSFFTEGGPVITTGKASAKELPAPDSINFTEKFAEKNALYFIVGWRQPVSHRVLVTTAASYLDFTKYREDNIRYVDSLSGDYKVRQAELYLSPAIAFNKRFTFAPAGRITYTTVTEPITSTDTIIKLYLGNPIAKTFSDFIIGGEITYARNYWKLNAGVWHISVSEKTSLQVSSSLVLLPLGNMNLYSLTGVLWNNKRSDDPCVFSQTIGGKIANKTWLEVTGSLGNLAGTAEYNGQLLNNQINKSNYRITTVLIRDITDKLRISLRYQYMQSESTVYYLDKNYYLLDDIYKYHRHIITGGITWNVL